MIGGLVGQALQAPCIGQRLVERVRLGAAQQWFGPAQRSACGRLAAMRAELDAMRMSHIVAKSLPAPMAAPLTAGMMGASSVANARGMRWTPVR